MVGVDHGMRDMVNNNWEVRQDEYNIKFIMNDSLRQRIRIANTSDCIEKLVKRLFLMKKLI